MVIDDPLPAGLEPVDTTLRTHGRRPRSRRRTGLDEPEDGAREDRIAEGTEYLSSWVHREMHDDRVLFFVEHLAAGMYHYRYLARATTLGNFVAAHQGRRNARARGVRSHGRRGGRSQGPCAISGRAMGGRR